MDNPCAGLYVRAFRLLPGEKLTYRIISEDGMKTVSEGTLTGSGMAGGASSETGIQKLARMQEYLDFHDDIAMDEAMTAFEKLDEMTDRLFNLR